MFKRFKAILKDLEQRQAVLSAITLKVQQMADNPLKITLTRKELEKIHSDVIECQKEFESEFENLSKELDRLKQMDQPN
jgi:hypothetical protein